MAAPPKPAGSRTKQSPWTEDVTDARRRHLYRKKEDLAIRTEKEGTANSILPTKKDNRDSADKKDAWQVLGSTLATMHSSILSNVNATKKGCLAALFIFLSLITNKLAQEIGYSTLDYSTDDKSGGREKMVFDLHNGIENEETTNEAAAIAVASLLSCGLICICASTQRKFSRPARCRCIMHEQCPHILQRPCARCQYARCRKCLGLCCSCRTCRR